MRYVIGFLGGAFLGAVGRFVVTFGWSVLAFGTDKVFAERDGYLLFSLISGGIGFAVGGVGGVTCVPRLGLLLGGALSGCSCLLAWIPIHLFPITVGNPTKGFTDAWEGAWNLYWLAFPAMIIVGAAAGAGGAWIGDRFKAKPNAAGNF
jgi:hypothetical protein